MLATAATYELTFVNILLGKQCICLLSWSSLSSDDMVHNLTVCYTENSIDSASQSAAITDELLG